MLVYAFILVYAQSTFFWVYASSAYSLEIEISTECPMCIKVDNNTCYNVSHVLDLEAPFRNEVVIHKIGILRSDNILFFSFEPQISDSEYYKIGFIHLDSKENKGVISGGQDFNFGTFDIDQENNMIYMGGSRGIFVLDHNNKQLMQYSSVGDTISGLFFKEKVYFIRPDEDGIIIKQGDYFKTIVEYLQVNKFVVTKENIYVVLNKFGLLVSNRVEHFYISYYPFFRGLTVDLDGVPFAWWIDGIYRIDVSKNLRDSKLVKVLNLSGIGAMTFDNDNNVLYTSENSLLRITKTVC